ncbi:hypothetical protein D3C80_1642810 [compost metagenome]
MARFSTAKPTKPENAATPLFSRAMPSGMAMANITGRKLKANEPILLIQVNNNWKAGWPINGIRVMTSRLLSELPIPSMMPQNDSRATGSMNVLPRLWKNSQSVIFCFLGAGITGGSWRKSVQKWCVPLLGKNKIKRFT